MANTAQTMRFKIFDGVALCIHAAEDPAQEEWGTYIAAIVAARPPATRFLVYSAGGGPNVLQRKQMTTMFKAQGEPYVAIVSHSAIVRNITTAFNFIVDKRMKAFKPSELAEAIDTLNLAPKQRAEMVYHLLHLSLDIGVRIDPKDARREAGRSAAG